MEKNPYDIESEVESFHWWFVVRRKLLKSILSYLDVPINGVTLDIGCGAGSNLRALVSAGLYAIGLDRSTYALTLARRKGGGPLLAGDLNKLPIKTKSVGLIIGMDILEHLEDDSNGISEFHRALREGGILLLTVPAFKSLWGIQDVVTGHKRRYTKKEILNKLRQGGFNILKSSYYNFFLFIPILLGRRLMHIFGLKIESENEINFPILNFFLKTIFSLEPHILKRSSFPFGVSIFCIARKSDPEIYGKLPILER
ncbi:MAG: class I SAM-dependent methyltransferase [Thermodesulfobacteriota bacterium]